MFTIIMHNPCKCRILHYIILGVLLSSRLVFTMTSLCLSISVRVKWWCIMNTGTDFHYVSYVSVCVRGVCQRQNHSHSSPPRNHSSSLPNSHGGAPVTLARASLLPSAHHYCQIKSQKRTVHLPTLITSSTVSFAVLDGDHAHYRILGTHPKPIIIRNDFKMY